MEKSAAPGTLGSFAADLHIHVGRALGRPVKITASPALTLEGILEECAYRKGIQAAGLVDALSPPVREELATSIRTGTLRQVDGGGLLYGEAAAPVLLVPAIELELRINDAPAHFLIYLPDLGAVEELAAVLKGRLDHPHLSTRPCRIDPCALASLSGDLGGFLIPAHAFTPHKGVLGAAVDRLSLIFGPLPAESVPALELGLSADTALADRIAEHSSLTFLSNSDAHSRASIGREFNLLCLAELSFAEIRRAVLGLDGRGVVANYGLDPELGKYRRSACLSCRRIASEPPPVQRCPRCGGPVVMGVDDRVSVIADRPPGGSPPHRPPYRHQVPFSFLPGVGAKAAARLTAAFGSERRALHEAAPDQLEAVVGKKTAAVILAARRGEIFLRAGGGGRYGKTVVKPSGPGP